MGSIRFVHGAVHASAQSGQHVPPQCMRNREHSAREACKAGVQLKMERHMGHGE